VSGTGPDAGAAPVVLCFAAGLRFFLPVRHRAGEVAVRPDGTSSLGHLVESAGVPLTEVGTLTVDGSPVPPGHRPRGGQRAHVEPVGRPQPVPGGWPPRFVLDVHLGALARRMRLVGLDVAYRNDASDPALVEQANAGARILLTQDRGLLRRRALWLGAYVRGSRADGQLADVLERFAPPLAPWTRCTACNGTLAPVAKADVAHLLRPGTRRTYDTFARCVDCGRVYWHGAHARRLADAVAQAEAVRRGPDCGGGSDSGGAYRHAE
jgi:uncharacterized protein